jgi:hypothetical protein
VVGDEPVLEVGGVLAVLEGGVVLAEVGVEVSIVEIMELDVAQLGLGDDGEPGAGDLALHEDLGGRGDRGSRRRSQGSARASVMSARAARTASRSRQPATERAEAGGGAVGAVLLEQGGADDDRAGL